MLVLTFVQPMDVELVLVFSIEHQAMLVETMFTGGGVYLQSGVAGDRLSTTMDAQRILVELPHVDADVRSEWERRLLKRMTVVIARRLGVRRNKARAHAEAFIGEMRKFTQFRMPGPRPERPGSDEDQHGEHTDHP